MAQKRTAKAKDAPAALPDKNALLAFIRSADETIGKREIARAFHIKGADRIELKRMLKELADDGLISNTRRRFKQPGRVQPVSVIEIRGRDGHGECYAVPSAWDEASEGAPPRILVLDARKGAAPPGIGEQWLARIEPVRDGEADGYGFTARPIKRLPRETLSELGIYRETRSGAVIEPINKKQMKEWRVAPDDAKGVQPGELVRFTVAKHRQGMPTARIAERLGNPEAERAVSLIAIHNHGLPYEFPAAVEKSLEALEPPSLKGREDLRKLPLVTIDPVDARDHDDAVWAAPDDTRGNEGGFQVIVAIADVAFYVRPGTPLDIEARRRGNSVYFPDRVVPMLPERLSNDLCSLKEGVDRPCLAVRMTFARDGRKLSHRFMRAMMRSAAKLNYVQAQSAIDGKPDDATAPLLEPALKPLWAAYAALKTARDKRSPLDLDLPERKIILGEDGHVRDVVVPPRLDAHRLIEEFMIQANVAAAEALEEAKSPLLYRIHDAPSQEKLAALQEFLATLGLPLAKSPTVRPAQFNRILARAHGTEFSDLVNEVILRSQAQAEYSARNIGHFGLNLRRYAHFTSPIRRYADLVVHRGLIRAFGLGAGGLSDAEVAELDKTAEHISTAERRAMAAERETIDRLIAFHLADRIGTEFSARISGVAKTGLFVRLETLGADGFIPAVTLGRDYYRFSERDHALIGERTGETFRLGDRVEVRLADALPAAGALRFELLTSGRIERRGKGRAKRPLQAEARQRAQRSGRTKRKP